MHRLYEKIKHLPKIDRIVAITRGGLVPACLLSQIMNCRKIETICMQSYSDDNKKVGPPVAESKVFNIADEHVLLLDDICDSGESLKVAKYYLEAFSPVKVTTAVLVERTTAKFKPDYSIEVVDSGKWIEFFWEDNFDFDQKPLDDPMWREKE